jgi:hypothetical protein
MAQPSESEPAFLDETDIGWDGAEMSAHDSRRKSERPNLL